MMDAAVRTQSLISRVAAVGGVARASSLRRDGECSAYDIAKVVRAGALIRVRRDWVATPEADAELVAAAREGVVLSCITLARRLGLWVTKEDRCHVAADPGARGSKTARAVVHWSKPLVPRPPDALCDSVENALVLVATCQSFEDALATWDSAVRRNLVSLEILSRLALPPRSRAVLAAVDPLADSGLETLFRTRLRWLRVRILAQIWLLGHRVDFLIGERLVVQIDGGHHVGAQREADLAHDAALMLAGYHVLRFGYAQIISDWPHVQDVIARAVAQSLHHAR